LWPIQLEECTILLAAGSRPSGSVLVTVLLPASLSRSGRSNWVSQSSSLTYLSFSGNIPRGPRVSQVEIGAQSLISQEEVVNGNVNGRKKRRKRLIIIVSIISVVVLGLIIMGGMAIAHGSSKIDPSKLAKVDKADLAKSVVATGKVEPITKVEVK